jgi:hypothetical protein
VNEKLEAALAYGRMHWRIFPCHSIVEGHCSCGRANCSSPGKHPRTRAGFKEATDDGIQIRRWWTRWPDTNIALATGSGLAVFDIDGEEGLHEFEALVASQQPLLPTLVAQTGRGYHLVFSTRPDSPEVRSSARGNVHVRGEGGYIIVAPSSHISGNNYRWIKKNPVALLPDWLRQWSQGYDIANKTAGRQGFDHLGPAPPYLQTNQASVTERASEALKTVYSASEEMRLKSALSTIPADRYEPWTQVGMALKDLGWERSDGTDIGLDLWIDWSETCEAKFSYAACEAKWASFRRSGVTLGTVYHLAQQHGWNGGAPAPVGSPLVSDHGPGLNGTANGVHALPAAFGGQQPIFFPDLDDRKRPRPTCTNAGVAVQNLQIVCEKDQFHEKLLTGGHMIEQWAGDLTDEVIQMLRKTIRARFGFDPGEKNVRDACVQLALENQFDPVLDYLDGLKWDGTPRLDSWMVRYMGSPDTELNRIIGRLVLIAAVRRQRRPGTKFDQIVVLESKEGFGKSTAIEILAGADNFSDQSILNKQEREQQEAMCGVWLYEIADLTGMRKADIEHIKAFASRTWDRARPAYGRFRVDRPRRTVFFATTNDDEYLKSQTGNRRFWPVTVSRIDLIGLRRDRDQIWAEASVCEARGDSIGLPERLWHAASEEQNQRLESDEWSAAIDKYLQEKNKLDVSIMEVLVDNQFLQIEPGRVGRPEQIRAGAILRRMGMLKYRKRLSGNAMEWRYRKA